MPPPPALFASSLSRRAVSLSVWNASARRYAHAAAFPQDADDARPDSSPQAGPSRPRRRMEDYRFPERGVRGGPPDPFEVLGLKRSAGGGEIKAAYYKLALILHPDSSHPSASAEHFATLSKAYKLLSTPSSRTSYLQTGYGWVGSNPSASPNPGDWGPQEAADAEMRSWARHAKRHGAASWEAGARARGFRSSEGGSAGYYHTHPGEDYPFHDRPPEGRGDVIYMPNAWFVAFIATLASVGAFVQFYRVGQVVDSTREMLVDRHLHASKALAEAREEAQMFGKERREQLRKRVRENTVMNEIHKMEKGEESLASHSGIVPEAPTERPPPPPPTRPARHHSPSPSETAVP